LNVSRFCNVGFDKNDVSDARPSLRRVRTDEVALEEGRWGWEMEGLQGEAIMGWWKGDERKGIGRRVSGVRRLVFVDVSPPIARWSPGEKIRTSSRELRWRVLGRELCARGLGFRRGLDIMISCGVGRLKGGIVG